MTTSIKLPVQIIPIRTGDAQNLTVDVDPTWTIATFKTVIQEQLGLPEPQHFRCVYQGKPMNDGQLCTDLSSRGLMLIMIRKDKVHSDPNIAKLVAFGFDVDQVVVALKTANGNLDAAANSLLEGQEVQ